jgi:hypothetical protein
MPKTTQSSKSLRQNPHHSFACTNSEQKSFLNLEIQPLITLFNSCCTNQSLRSPTLQSSTSKRRKKGTACLHHEEKTWEADKTTQGPRLLKISMIHLCAGEDPLASLPKPASVPFTKASLRRWYPLLPKPFHPAQVLEKIFVHIISSVLTQGSCNRSSCHTSDVFQLPAADDAATHFQQMSYFARPTQKSVSSRAQFESSRG